MVAPSVKRIEKRILNKVVPRCFCDYLRFSSKTWFFSCDAGKTNLINFKPLIYARIQHQPACSGPVLQWSVDRSTPLRHVLPKDTGFRYEWLRQLMIWVEAVMGSGDTSRDMTKADTAAACPLASPLIWYIPGLFSLVAVPAAIVVNPFFFGLAGSLLAGICLLLSPPHSRSLGVIGLIGAVAGGSLGVFVLR
jgi:hypothetical protein